MNQRSRRFIAGAICPSCQQMDKLFVYSDSGSNHCECVNCGFKDAQDRNVAPGTEAFKRGLGAPDDTSVVRILDPSQQ
jgi:uncharacterized protein